MFSLTRGVGLTVVFKVLERFADRFRGNAAVRTAAGCDQQQTGLSDAAGSSSDGPPPVHLHGHVHHGPAPLKGDGRRVTPATLRTISPNSHPLHTYFSVHFTSTGDGTGANILYLIMSVFFVVIDKVELV